MNRTTLMLFGLLIILAAGAYFTQSGKKKNYNEGDQIAILNPNAIHKVFIADRRGSRILLTREKDHWVVNEKYKARQKAMDLVLETFEKMRVKNYVPKAAEKNVVMELRNQGIKVEAYNKADKPIKVYYIGGMAPDGVGSYILQEDDENLYVAYLRGWEGELAPRFMINEIDWRDKGVFTLNSDNITEVVVEYPLKPDASFKLEKKGKEEYAIYPLKAEQAFSNTNQEPDKGKVLYFLKGFEKQIAEAFEPEHPSRDSIVQTIPYCSINVTDSKGAKKKVDLYPIPGRQMGVLPDGSPRRAAVERYYASVNDNEEFMLVQHLLFQRVLAPYSFFFEEEK